jgi:1,4-dihydroxy-2-naphthoate octaprenyltransferase
MRGRLSIWLKALRAHFLPATVSPVLIGTAAAWFQSGRFDPVVFILALVGGIFVHLGANLSNDYFDARSEADALNLDRNALSGGSRVIQDGLIPASRILIAAVACLAAGALIGLYLVWRLESLTLLVLGIVGVFCAYFYTGAPLRLGYRGLAEALNGISFGPIITLGAYVVQAGNLSAVAALASVPPGMLLACLLMINEFPDHDADRAVGKRTIVVNLGKKNALGVYHAAMFFSFLWVPVFAIAGIFPPWTLVSLLSFPFALRAYASSRRNYADSAALVTANVSTLLLHLFFNTLLAAGFLVSRL